MQPVAHDAGGKEMTACPCRQRFSGDRPEHRNDEIWDNAVAESFFATLKTECVYTRRFATRAEAREAIFEFIEVFYNGTRRHSTLGYLSPVEFEMKFNQETSTEKKAA